VVAETPGTTRDSVDTVLDYRGQRMTLIDTAGIRRRGRIQPGIEKYSALRAFQAISRCDIAVLLLDASELATLQDTHVAGYILESDKGLVLAVNKWDLAPELGLDQQECDRAIRSRFRFAPFAPVLYVSALRHLGIQNVLDTASLVYAERQKRIEDADLKHIIEQAAGEHPPGRVGHRRLHILGARQTGVNPPTFVFSVNDPDALHFSYHRYLENRLRELFGFAGTPLRMVFKRRGEE
jgi:GTP-binding protein